MEIEFEGKKVKPNAQGFYKCPYCKPNGYPAKKWKTSNGFIKHTQECGYAPSKVKIREEKQASQKAEFELLKQEALKLSGLRIDDEIYYVKEITVKPEYEQRGTRRVRVRYEAVMRYEAVTTKIASLDFIDLSYAPSAEYVLNNSLVINLNIRFRQICLSKQIAEEKAKERQINHEEHLRFSAECR